MMGGLADANANPLAKLVEMVEQGGVSQALSKDVGGTVVDQPAVAVEEATEQSNLSCLGRIDVRREDPVDLVVLKDAELDEAVANGMPVLRRGVVRRALDGDRGDRQDASTMWGLDDGVYYQRILSSGLV